MLSALHEAVTSPASFFAREADDPSLRGPALVVTTLALLGVVSSLPVFGSVLENAPDEAAPFVLAGLAFGVAVGAVVPFVVWLVYAALFYGLSSLFDGEGEFRDLFALVGWGFGPRILASVFGAVVLYVGFPASGFADPQAARQFSQGITTGPLGIANRVFGLLMTLWAAWIWTHAVAEARNIETREAGIVVGIVVAVAVLLSLGSTFLLPP